MAFSLNTNRWIKDSIDLPIIINTFSLNASYKIFSFRLLKSKDDSVKEKDRVSFYILGGVQTRRLGGDYGLDKNKDKRILFLGTDNLAFNCFNLGARLNIANFYAEVDLTSFARKDNIDGFSGNQVLFNLGLRADINLPVVFD